MPPESSKPLPRAIAADRRAPHPATVVQPRAPHPAMVVQPRAPHPATVVQPRAPHPATVVQPRAPHPATVAQPRVRVALPARPPHAAVQRAAELTGADDAKIHDGDKWPWEAAKKKFPGLPVVTISKAQMPYIHAHIFESILNHRSPVILTYDEKGDHDATRAKAFEKGVEIKLGLKQAATNSKDEYPFACTLEGGSDSTWAWVPAAEQNTQGGLIGAVVRKILKEADSLNFIVALAP